MHLKKGTREKDSGSFFCLNAAYGVVPDGRSVSIALTTAEVMPIIPACQALIARKDNVSSQAWHDLFGHGVIYVGKKNNKAYGAGFFYQYTFSI